MNIHKILLLIIAMATVGIQAEDKPTSVGKTAFMTLGALGSGLLTRKIFNNRKNALIEAPLLGLYCPKKLIRRDLRLKALGACITGLATGAFSLSALAGFKGLMTQRYNSWRAKKPQSYTSNTSK